MQRVMIVGISGAGKSTLSRRLGKKLKVPFHHLDNIFHLPSWVPRPDEEVQKDFDAIAVQDKWVVDGNYRPYSALLRERAELIVFLDFGRVFALRQILTRWLLHKLWLKRRKDLGKGFEEQMPLSFLMWVWHWRRDNRPKWLVEFEKAPERIKVFRNRQEVNQWLAQL